jgi:hypothetical protein
MSGRDSDALSEEIQKRLDRKADLAQLAQLLLDNLRELDFDGLETGLRVIDRYPPPDWSQRVEALFADLQAKKASVRQWACRCLCFIGGGRYGNVLAAPKPNLHPPDLWPRLLDFADGWKDRTVSIMIREAGGSGVRGAPDPAAIEEHIVRVNHWGEYATSFEPCGAMIAWLARALELPSAEVRAFAAQAAANRTKLGKDIGALLAPLGRLLEDPGQPRNRPQPRLWAAAALAEAARHDDYRRAALAELESRLTGKAVAREAAAYGLGMAYCFLRDWKRVRALLADADGHIRGGACRGLRGSWQHLDMPRERFVRHVAPVHRAVLELAQDPRKPVREAALSFIQYPLQLFK